MKDKAFLDTNIFVYAIDSSPELTRKTNIARELIREQIQQETGVISIQVVQEFFQVSTQKIETPITTEDALLFIQHISVLQMVAANLDMVVSAVHLQKRCALSFWDSLILQAAKSADCSWVFSEDLPDDFRLNGLVVKNPFSICTPCCFALAPGYPDYKN